MRLLRRVLVLVVGSIVTIVGVAMIFTPGPAVLVIPAGLAILATEFSWAKTMLARFRDSFKDAAQSTGKWWDRLAEKFQRK